MSVNALNTEQAYQLIADLHEMATGVQTVTPTDLSDFISVAQATLAAGTEKVLNAISQVVGRTIYAVRDYNRKFNGLEVSADKWGGIIRKISFADRDPIDAEAYSLTDGTAVDQYKVRKANVLETRYVGSDVWDGCYTIYTDQLITAFSSPAAFSDFMAALMQHFSNEREQWLEDMARASLANFIGAKAIINSGADVIHLLTEYNAATGLSLTSTTVKQPANYPPFIRWCYARINDISDKMTERSQLYQQVITNKPIFRHTPKADQRAYISADILSSMRAEVKSITYNESFLDLAETEAVGYWQAIDSPNALQVTPVYVDTSGTVTVGAAQSLTNVIGVIFDRDAICYNVKVDTMETTPYNAKGRYWNLFNHLDIQYQNDFTEKGVVLCLD